MAGVFALRNNRDGAMRAPARTPILLAVAVCLLMLGYHLVAHVHSPDDYPYFWEAGRAVLSGKSPYSTAGFYSAPFASLLFAPFALLPLSLSAWAWRALNVALLGLTIFQLGRLLRSRAPTRFLVAGAAVVLACFPPVQGALRYGQTDIILVLGYATGFLYLQERRWIVAGLAFSVGALDPQLMVAVVIYLALTGRWRALFASTVTGVALGTLGLLVPGHLHSTVQWFTSVLPQAERMMLTSGPQITYTAALHSIPGIHELDLRIIGLVVDAGLVALAWSVWRLPGSTQRDMAVVAFLTLTITPFVWEFDYALVLLAVPYVLDAMLQGGDDSGHARAWPAWICLLTASFFTPILNVSVGPIALLHNHPSLIRGVIAPAVIPAFAAVLLYLGEAARRRWLHVLAGFLAADGLAVLAFLLPLPIHDALFFLVPTAQLALFWRAARGRWSFA